MVVRAIAGLLAATVLGTMAACGSTDKTGNKPPPYTYAEAVRMADDIVLDATRDLNPHPKLEIAAGGDAPCAGPNDDTPTEQVMYERVYWLRIVPSTMNASVTDQLEQYWKANGYVIDINDMNDIAGVGGTVVVSKRATGFKMKLVKATNGDLNLSAQSPCVNEAASPAPT
jgi:hypothetical protein